MPVDGTGETVGGSEGDPDLTPTGRDLVLRFLGGPPRWWFHLCLALPAGGWLIALSVPGFNYSLYVQSVAALGVLGLVWVVRLIGYGAVRFLRQATRPAWWFLIAPAVGALCVGLLYQDVPLKVRWHLSRSEFQGAVDEAMADGDDWSGERQRLGLYTVRTAYRQGEAVIFYERHGALSNDAGFAYLPDGPFPELENGGFENPQFRHLDGNWYTWTASW